MSSREYQVVLTPEEEGGYSVTVPALPGCTSQGESRAEALEMIREAIELYLESLASPRRSDSRPGRDRASDSRRVTPRLPAVTPRQAARALERCGWNWIASRGAITSSGTRSTDIALSSSCTAAI
jgi:antitoxin HicB